MPDTTRSAVPSTAAQREIWAASQLGSDASLAFNEAVAIRLDGPLNVRALETALQQIVARHDALRGHFTEGGDRFLLSSAPALALPRTDARGLSAGAQQATCHAVEATLVGTPFELTRGPLLRAALVQLTDTAHVLYLGTHHIVCDGWSFGVIGTELGEAYSAACAGRAPRLAPANTLVEWQEALDALADDPDTAAAQAWWLAQYPDEVAPLALPTDHPRPVQRRFEAARVDLALPAATVHALRECATREQVSLFTLLLTTYAALLQRLTTQETLVVGIPAAGQPALGLPQLVSHCVHLLPLRLSLHEQAPVRDVLTHTRTVLLDALDHQQISYGALLEELPLRRDPSRPPLVQVAFNLDKGLGSDALGFAGCEALLTAVPRQSENFELFLNAVELGDQITLELQYSTALFTEATAQRWLAAFSQVAAALPDALATPGFTVRALPVITPADRALHAQFALARSVPVDVTRLVVTRVAEEAAARPSAPAVTAGANTLTYAELDAQVNRLARTLRRHGVRRGCAVAALLPRDERWPLAMLATWRAGGVYVPLDVDLPDGRLQFMMRDASVSHLVTETALIARAGEGAHLVVDLVAESAMIAAESAAPLPPSADDASADDTAYVIYTSGSTGTPKGCLNTHRGLLNFALSNHGAAGPERGGTALLLAAPCFDAAVGEVAMALVAGARLVVVGKEDGADGRRLAALIASERVTFFFSTPTRLRLLLEAGWAGQRGLTIACGGEAMTPELAIELAQRADAVWNVYGPTETAVWVCAASMTPVPERITLGRPLMNTRLDILDAHGDPVPVGVPGELWIAGPNVAAGYLNRSDLSAERFAPDPQAPGGRRYRTGDKARWLSTGEVEYLGRFDDQVKLRGYRIELGEIANALAACAHVAAAEVLVREDHTGDKRLVAYVQPTPGATVQDAELRAALARQLPSYMVPQAYVTMHAWPLLPSGKVNRHALPAPSGVVASTAVPFRAPGTEREVAVAAAWARALRVPRVSIDDDFFEIGGHSLLASLVLSDLRARHGIDIPYRLFFESPTVARLAVAIEAYLASHAGTPVAAPIVRTPLGPTSPATVQQVRNWMVETMHPEHGYVLVHGGAWRLHGPLDTARFEAAMADVVTRQESMRTGFVLRDGVLHQVVHESVPSPVRHVSIEAIPEAEREAAMMAACEAARGEALDMGRPPLFRALLIRYRATEHVLFTLQHGLVWDGYSFDVFLADLCAAYAARQTGEAPAWPPLPIRYRDYAEWQPGHFASPAFAAERAWWQRLLPNPLPLTELPTDAPRGSGPSYEGGRMQLRLPRAEVDVWQQAAKRAGATLYQYLLSVFHVLLHRYSGQRALLVGMPLRNRPFHELDHLIGAFTNTVPLHTEVDPAQSFASLLAHLRGVCVEAIDNQEVPFELLERRAPSLRAVFSMQDATGRPARMGDCELVQFTLTEHTAASDLTLWAMQYPDSLLLVVNFRTDLFRADTAEQLLAHLRQAAHEAAREPARPLQDFLAGSLPTPATATPAPSLPRFAVPGALQSTTAAAIAGLMRLGYQAGDTLVASLRKDRDVVALQFAAAHLGIRLVRLAAGDHEDYQRHVANAAGARHIVGDTVRPTDATPDSAAVPRLAFSAVLTAGGEDAGTAALRDALTWHAQGGSAVLTHTAAGLAVHPLDAAAVYRQATALSESVDLQASDTVLDLATGAGDGIAAAALAAALVGATRIGVDAPDELEGEDVLELLEAHAPTVLLLTDEQLRELQRVQWAGAPTARALLLGPVPSDRAAWLAARVAVCRLAVMAPGVAGVLATEPVHALVGALAGALEYPRVLAARAARVAERGRPTLEADALVAGVLELPEGVHATGTSDVGALVARRRRDGITLDGHRAPAAWLGSSVLPLTQVTDAVVQALPGADVRVQLRPDSAGVPRLVAYLRGDAAPTPGALREALQRTLPRRAIPSFVVTVGEWPLDASGAEDLAPLPNPAQRHTAPRRTTLDTPAEQWLGALWSELLGVARIAPEDNFFALGGYSLLCFQMLDRVERHTGAAPSARQVLFGTLEQLARELTLPVEASR